jgi:hypothetical protein
VITTPESGLRFDAFKKPVKNPNRSPWAWPVFFAIESLLIALGCATLLGCVHTSRVATSGPEIVGAPQFSNQVRQALLVLQTRDAEAYDIVTKYVGRIKQGERSGMWAYKNPPTYEMATNTALYSVTWCAATIAHDSFHSMLYHECQRTNHGSVPDAVWTGKEAEKQCMKHQLAVMERIGAPAAELEHARKEADGNYVKDKETWQDYRERKW